MPLFTLQNSLLFFSVLLTALVAGLLYGYACSVNPGLGHLSDLEYVKAMKSINFFIQNPFFFASFMGTLLILPITAGYTYFHPNGSQFYFLLIASLVYIIGVFGVTMLGNVPLNEVLAQFDPTNAGAADLSQQRQNFEEAWNRLHLIRTIASILSLSILIISLLKNR